jgi:cystathionine gamma-synthase
MRSINASENRSKFIMTAEALNNALPDFHMATRAIHADDFVSPHRAIAPGIHTAVNFRYARDPDELVPEENKDVRSLSGFISFSALTRTAAKCAL